MASSGPSWGVAAVRQVQSSMLAWSEDIHVQQFRALRPCDLPAHSPSLIAASAVSMTECPLAQPLIYSLFHHRIWCSAYMYCAISNQSSPSPHSAYVVPIHHKQIMMLTNASLSRRPQQPQIGCPASAVHNCAIPLGRPPMTSPSETQAIVGALGNCTCGSTESGGWQLPLTSRHC